MKIVRYEKDWEGHYGLLVGDVVHELIGDVYGEAEPGQVVGKMDELKLLAPCCPDTIWSNGANYPSRCEERGFEMPETPQVLRVPGSVISGPNDDVRIPGTEKRSEYGAELGFVIGKDCHKVEEEDADDYILGYTALNNIWTKDPDWVDYKKPTRVYDSYCPTGPVVDTEIDWRDLAVRLWVDGEVRQDDRTSTVAFSPQRLIAFISHLTPMKQGDLVMTGTPGGIEGHVLHYGEVVEMEIEGIGRIKNRIVRIDAGTITHTISVSKWVEAGSPR